MRDLRVSIEPNVFLTDACNQRCLFCSSAGEDRVQTPAEIRACILANKGGVSLEGGEPALCRHLPKWTRFARRSGVRDIMLCTNGSPFVREAPVRALLRAGVT
ncbi:MAG: hypothetical protein PHF00_12230, partial [Elusimicrobia bacterium]|nr:hypothetical protein [Elusimicrobiota bacterium]